MLPFFKLYVTFYHLSTVIYYIYPANYTIETAYFVQLAVFCKAGLFQFRVAFKSFAFTVSHSRNGLREIQFHCGALMTLPLFVGLTDTSFFACGRNEVCLREKGILLLCLLKFAWLK